MIAALRRMLAAPVPRAGAGAGVIRASGRLVVFGLQLFLVRAVVDATAFGVYAWGQNLMFLLGGLFALGLPTAAARLVAIHDHYGDIDRQRAVIARARWLMGGFSLIFVAAGALLLMLLPAVAGPSVAVAMIAVVAAPLVAFTLFHEAVARAQSHLVVAFLPTQVLRPALTGLLAVIILVVTDAPLTAIQVLGAVVASLFLVLLGQWFVVRPRQRLERPGGGPERVEECAPRRLMGVALTVFATRVSELARRYSAILLLGIFTGPTLVGSFFVADRLAELIALPALVVASVIQPWLASAFATGDRARMQHVVTQAVHTALWPTLAAALVVIVGAETLLGLFGSEFRNAAPILFVLVLAHVCTAILGPNPQILIMTGHQSLAFRIAVLAAVVHVLMLAILVPGLGTIGAAWSTLVSNLVAGAAALGAVRLRLGLRSSILLGAGFLRCA